MLQWLSGLLVLCAGLPGANVVSGTVQNAQGAVPEGARVFLELGIGGQLRETLLSPGGAFSFDEVPQGTVGLFAVAPGYGFAGRSYNVTLADDLEPALLVLSPAGSLSGVVTNDKGDPVEGAQITRVALLGQYKVGIPLNKLHPLGFPLYATDQNGRYDLPNLPASGDVALKVMHPSYATEGVAKAPIGNTDYHITLYRGVFVQGEVRSRDQRLPVARAAILITNAQPPFDTTITESDAFGGFAVRLKPGVYTYRASGPGLRSPGGEKLVVTGGEAQPPVRLFVAGTGFIKGTVKDAISGAPVAGAQVRLFTSGNLAAITRTGTTGEFRFTAMEGENVVRLELAPGYLPPEAQASTVRLAQGEEKVLPDMWVAPIPAYQLSVIDDEGAPVPRAVVTLLRPYQFGWQQADAQGKVALRAGRLPEDGRVMGLAEDLNAARGALFSISPEDANDAAVRLMPYANVSGRVVSSRGKGIEGAVVGGEFAWGEDTLLLWRTVSQDGGGFTWSNVIPSVPQRCVAWAGEDAEGASITFVTEEKETKDLGNIVVKNGEAGDSMLGKKLSWDQGELLAGELPEDGARKNRPTAVVYCPAAEADMVIEGLDGVRQRLARPDLLFAVVVSGTWQHHEAPLPVLAGEAPGRATTYLLDDSGRVALEAFGLPPARALKNLSHSSLE